MKKLLILFFTLVSLSTQAQPNLEALQQSWVDDIKEGEEVKSTYWNGPSFTFTSITKAETESPGRLITSDVIPGLTDYDHLKTFRHDDTRYITVGYLNTKSQPLLLLTGWQNIDADWKKEIDIVLTLQLESHEVGKELDQALNEERKKWVELANQHNPEAHINTSYTEDSTYLGNGRKSEGRAEIIERYFYMENPNYQVDLEKEELWKVSKENVLEIGRYFTGAEKSGMGGLYVILWEKQEAGNWQINLDFNF